MTYLIRHRTKGGPIHITPQSHAASYGDALRQFMASHPEAEPLTIVLSPLPGESYMEENIIKVTSYRVDL